MDPVKVGVVGIGNMGQHHVRIYKEMPEVELVGVADISEDKGRLCSSKYHTQYFTDYRDLMGRVRAVNIVVPTKLHYQLAMEFLENDIHVLVEKPITVDIAQAKTLVDTAKSRNLVLQVGHLERFNPAVGELRRIVKRPLYVEVQRLSYPTRRNLDVGVVWDLMIHDLDILLNLVNSPVEEIHSLGLSVYSSHEDLAQVQLRFKNGCIASLLASRISGEKTRRLKIIEEDKTTSLDFINQTLAILRPPKRDLTTPPEYVPLKKDEPLRLELEHFTECVAMNKQPIVSGEDGKKALELAMRVVDNMTMVKDRGAIAKMLKLMAVAG